MLTITYLINRLPSRVLENKAPISVLSQFYLECNSSNQLSPRILGCVSYVHIHAQNQVKLDPRALKCIFFGYLATKKGYKSYHPASKKIISKL